MTDLSDVEAAGEAIRFHNRSKHLVVDLVETPEPPPPPPCETPQPSTLWSTGQVADLFHVSPSQVRRWRKGGVILAAKGGLERSHYRFRQDALEELIPVVQLPRKALLEITSFGHRGPNHAGAQALMLSLKKRADELLEPYKKRVHEKIERWREERVLSVYDDVELLLDEETTTADGYYVGPDGVERFTRYTPLWPCPICIWPLDLPLEPALRDWAKVLGRHLVSVHPRDGRPLVRLKRTGAA